MSNRNRRGGGHGKAGGRKSENNRIYAHPLPLVFSPVENSPSLFRSLGVFKGLNTEILNPHCEGIFDAATKSVWVTNSKDVMILWRRGFFGKGDLSRSEPSWHALQVNLRKLAGNSKYTCLISSINHHLVMTHIYLRDDLGRNPRKTTNRAKTIQT